MRMRHITATVAATLLAAPMIATAASNGKSDKPDFDKADTNGDGKIAVSEATASGVPKGEAKREDIDSDGKLTKADWKFVDMNPEGQNSSGSS